MKDSVRTTGATTISTICAMATIVSAAKSKSIDSFCLPNQFSSFLSPLNPLTSHRTFHSTAPVCRFFLSSPLAANTKDLTSPLYPSPSALLSSNPTFPIFYNDIYEVHLPPGHRFPMTKYRQVRELTQFRLRDNNAASVASSSSVPSSIPAKLVPSFRPSPLVSISDLQLVHCPEYINRFLSGRLTAAENRNVGFPWSRDGVDRALSSVGGTVAAAEEVCRRLSNGTDTGLAWSAHVAGGTHHAFFDRGEGFCVFSDIAVAARVALERYRDRVKRVLIIDLDVHQGNGNAVIFRNDPDVFTFSLHCAGNYFSEKQRSDLDIELPVGCTNGTYLMTLKYWLKLLFQYNNNSPNDHIADKNQNDSIALDRRPFDLVFYQAGVDVLGADRLGRMKMTKSGVQRRNEMVFDAVHEAGAGLIVTMGGGYPPQNDQEKWQEVIETHSDVYTGAYSFMASKCIT
uniref:Histone deacetylase domain-containing protein n=1 Tax=Corethron hystrix TaxID=216773 RepID=A0A7S1BH03_9STRA|mmetsp:Transcript_25080/g.57964  ORF Transcript_25080/g.57964 Transcript_25080/m.57964 type:complete len:457 (+) Transcript_25080:1-1371(+)